MMFNQIATSILEDTVKLAVDTLNRDNATNASAWIVLEDGQGNPDIFLTVHVTPGDIAFDLKAWAGFGWDTFVTESFDDASHALATALTVDEGVAF